MTDTTTTLAAERRALAELAELAAAAKHAEADAASAAARYDSDRSPANFTARAVAQDVAIDAARRVETRRAELADVLRAAEQLRARQRYSEARDAEAATREAVEQSLRELAQLEVGLRRHIVAIRAAREAHAEAANALNLAASAIQSLEGVVVPGSGPISFTELHHRRMRMLHEHYGTQPGYGPEPIQSWISFS